MDEKQAIQLLKKYSSSEKALKGVMKHSVTVRKFALKIAEKIKSKHPDMKIDMDFIKSASIIHDIGRFDCPPGKDSYKHGVIGAEILRKEGVDERFAHLCECHVGPGIPKEDVKRQGLNIPVKNYLPENIEEKIITYADNLIWGDTIQPSEKVVKRFTEEIDGIVGARAKKLNEEIEALMQ